MTILEAGGYFQEEIDADRVVLLSAGVDSHGNTSVTSATLSGGTDVGATIDEGGSQGVSVGGTASGTIINDGGHQYVLSGGLATDTIANDPGIEVVLAGGMAFGTVLSGGEQDVYGVAEDTIVDDGGLQIIEPGGAAAGTIINGGGLEIVSAGGSDAGAQVSGGEQDVYGTASQATVFAGSQVVEAGGTAFGTLVDTGGLEFVDYGGSDQGAQLSGGEQDVYGTATGVTVFAGSQVVYGTVFGTTVYGGLEIVGAGGSDQGAQLSGGEQDVYGAAYDVTVYAGSQVVENGGAAFQTTVYGGLEIVYAGGIDQGAQIYGEQDVYGTASFAIVYYGTQVVEAGGAANGTTLYGYTYNFSEIVDAGGTDQGAQIYGGGQDVYGTASDATIYYGSQVVETGGTAFGTTINGGEQDVYGTASGTTVNFGGTERVFLGGVADGTVVSSGGVIELPLTSAYGQWSPIGDNGVVIDGVTVQSGAIVSLDIYGGGSISDFVVSSGGRLQLDGGTASDTVVSSGGSAYVYSDGVADGTVVSSGGFVELPLDSAYAWSPSTDNVIDGVTIQSGAIVSLDINQGGSISDFVISGGGVESNDGMTTGTTVDAGGTEYVYGDGTATGTTVDAGGTEYIEGGTASGTVVSSGGYAYIYGGTADGMIVSSGGSIYLPLTTAYAWSPNTDNVIDGVTLQRGAIVELAIYQGGSISGFVVSGGSREDVYGGTATGTVVDEGYAFVYGSGSVATGTVVSGGGEYVEYGGVASGTFVSFEGLQQIYYGTAVSTMIGSGGAQYVYYGTATSATIGSGGHQYVEYGGTAAGTTIGRGGTEVVNLSGTATNTTIDGGTLELTIGAQTSGSIVFAGGGGILQIDSGTAAPSAVISGFAIGDSVDLEGLTFSRRSGALLGAGSVVTVKGAGRTYALQFDPAQALGNDVFAVSADPSGNTDVFLTSQTTAVVSVTSGETVSNITVGNGGTQTVQSGGTAVDTTVNSGGVQDVQSSGTAVDATIYSGGVQNVHAGGTASGTAINDGGYQYVSSGGVASNTIVYDPGIQVVSSGGTAVSSLLSGGEQDVYGSALATFVYSGGLQIVESGGSASGTTIDAGGTEYVQSGGTARDVSFAGTGGLLELDQASGLSGTLSNWAVGDTIDFVSASVTSAVISGSMLTVTESGNQRFSYHLAGRQPGTVTALLGDNNNGTDLVLSAVTGVPTVAVSIDNTVVNIGQGTGTVTFAFSAAPTDFSLSDVTSPDGTLSNLSGSGTTFTATFTANAGIVDNAATVSVTDGSWHDAFGNAGTGGSTAPFTVDTVTPTVAVSIDTSDVNLAHNTGIVTFAFSAAPASFTLTDTTAVGGTLSNPTGSGTTYKATFTAAANTDIANASVAVTAGSWQNADGNPGAGGTTAAFTVDTVTPTVAVSIDNTDVNLAHNTGIVTFAFSAAPASFTLTDTTAVGGTLSNLTGSGTTYKATFTAAANTDIANAAVAVTAGSWQNADGNPGAGGATAAFTVDTVSPTVAVSIDNTDVNLAHNTGTVTFAFSAAPASFTLADTSAVGGTLSNLTGSGTTYKATFTAAANTDIANAAVAVTAGSWQNADGNAGAGGATAAFTVDTVTPTVVVSIDNSDVNLAHNTGTVTFAFSAAPASFTLTDTTAVGGTLSNLTGSGTTYKATFTAAANTDIATAAVAVTAGSWQNADGNPGAGGATAAFTVDTVTPTVAVSIDNTNVNLAHDAGTVTFAFSAAPASFTLTDTSAVGGTLSNLTGSGTTYKANFTAAANTDIATAAVAVTAGSWQNADGNPGAGGATPAFTVDTVTPSVISIAASGPGITSGSGDAFTGNTVVLTAQFSAAVTVDTAGGTPLLQLNDGGTASYAGGSGTETLTFVYTVAAGQKTTDLAVTGLSPNGGTIQDAAGNAAAFAPSAGVLGGTVQVNEPNTGLEQVTAGNALVINTAITNAKTGTLDADGGSITITGAVTNAGTIKAENGGTVAIGGNLTGSGTTEVAEIFSGSKIELQGKFNSAAMAFQNNAGDTGVLVYDHSAAFGSMLGTVAGFASDGTHSDTLDLKDIAFASGVSWSYNQNKSATAPGGILTVKDHVGDTANINLLGQYLAAGLSASSASPAPALSGLFNLAADSSTGTLVTTSHHG